MQVAILPAVIGLGVVNRVLNKMVLVPMGTHAIFLAQTQTLIYTLVYSAILAARFRCGPFCTSCALRLCILPIRSRTYLYTRFCTDSQ